MLEFHFSRIHNNNRSYLGNCINWFQTEIIAGIIQKFVILKYILVNNKIKIFTKIFFVLLFLMNFLANKT
jgi:hypothetical protein